MSSKNKGSTPESLYLKMLRFESRVGGFDDPGHPSEPPTDITQSGIGGGVLYKKDDEGHMVTRFIDPGEPGDPALSTETNPQD